MQPSAFQLLISKQAPLPLSTSRQCQSALAKRTSRFATWACQVNRAPCIQHKQHKRWHMDVPTTCMTTATLVWASKCRAVYNGDLTQARRRRKRRQRKLCNRLHTLRSWASAYRPLRPSNDCLRKLLALLSDVTWHPPTMLANGPVTTPPAMLKPSSPNALT